MVQTPIDVLVVGAGPTGLTLACDLARRGVSFRVVSSAPAGFDGSRAKGLQPRSLEVLDDLGVLERLEPHTSPYPPIGLHLGPIGLPLRMYRRHRRTDDVPHPNTLLVAQFDTETALRSRLAELGGTVEFATTLTEFEGGRDLVTAHLRGPGGTSEAVRAQYLVGADGGSSTVRHGCGISFEGTTDPSDRMIVADLTLEGLSRNRWHLWPRGRGRFLALCPLPGGRFQLMSRLKPGEDADVGLPAVRRVVAAVNRRVTVHEVHSSSVWRPNVRLAGSYRSGRVLLAGDAAHVHPPTGAQGMNTGIQDAYNLGWKLAQVLSGAGEELLNTYGAERRPVAAGVLGLSTQLFADLEGRPRGAVKRGDAERQLQLSYVGGPLASTGGPGPGPGPGDRAPDGAYTAADGSRATLHEAFRGPQFTLLAFGPEAVDGVPDGVWPERGAPLQVIRIPRPSTGLWRSYRIDGPVQVLVRPDGYIASRARGDWEAALTVTAARMATVP